MATLNIEGHSVTVDDSFLKLSPDEQNATVDEIAASLPKRAAPAAPAAPTAPAAAAPAAPSQWDLFKSGLSAIAQDPSKILNVGPLKGVQEGGELVHAAAGGQLPALPSDYTPAQSDAAVGLASMMVGGTPRGLMPQGPGMVRAVADAVSAPRAAPVNDALSQAARLGMDIPAFVASDSPAVQALGQASRQLPLAGGIIEKAANKFTGDLAAKAGEIGASLSPQTGLDKAALGEQLRTTLETAADNLTEIGHRSYAGVRNMIEPSKPVPAALEPIQNTLSDVMARRMEAGETGLGNLAPVANLLQRPGGPSFAGLQRARSRLGKAIDFDARMGGGMEQGDLKQVYGAVTDAMGQAVAGAAKTDPAAAVSAWKVADQEFATNLGNMRSLSKALKSPSDEALVNQVVGMAGEKTGNAKRLVQLQQDIGPESMRMLGAHVMDQAAGAGDTWSAARFSTAMDKLSNTAKSVLFGPSRPMVEDLHALASRWAEQESKFANRSNTGRAALTGGMLGALAAHPLAFIGKTVAGAVAGVTLGQVLSRPATARAAVQAARAAERHALNPTLSSRNAAFALQRQLTTAVIREFGDRSATGPSSPGEAPSPTMSEQQ